MPEMPADLMPTDLLPAILLLDIGGLTAGAAALLTLRRLRADDRALRSDLIWLALIGAVLATTAVVITAILPFGGFALLRLLTHALFCVLLPLCALQAFLICRQRPRSALLLWLLFGGGEAVYLYARHIGPYDLEVTRYEVVTPHLADQPITIVVMADLQTDRITDYERMVFRQIDAQRADLILLPGDFLQQWRPGDNRQYLALRDLFLELQHKPRLGIFAVEGDCDLRTRNGNLPVLRGTGVRVLANETVQLTPALQLTGLRLWESRQPLRDTVSTSVRSFPGLSLVMGHAPDYMLPYMQGRADLDALGIAGHCHGGQIRVPFLGPPITLSRIPRRYTSGLHKVGNLHFHVSRGIGMERGVAPRIRLFCRPELSVITLVPRSDGR